MPQIGLRTFRLFIHLALFGWIALELMCLDFRAVPRCHFDERPVLRIRHPYGALGGRGKSINRIFAIVSLLRDFVSRLLKGGAQRVQLSRLAVKDIMADLIR